MPSLFDLFQEAFCPLYALGLDGRSASFFKLLEPLEMISEPQRTKSNSEFMQSECMLDKRCVPKISK